MSRMRNWAVMMGLVAGVAVNDGRAAEPASIQNEHLKVTYDGAVFTVTHRASGRAFASARVEGMKGGATVAQVRHARLGDGQALAVSDARGGGRVVLYAGLPFAVVQGRVTNTEAAPVDLNKIPLASISLDIGPAPAALKGFGTGGLTALTANAGSYMWQAIVEPRSRNGVVGGWLGTERGSGVVFAGQEADRAQMTARVEYGRLRLDPGQSEDLEAFAFGYFEDARLGLEAWADTVARILDVKLRPQPVVYCTWYHARASNEKDIAALAEFSKQQLAPFGFSVVQIDDGWQDGAKNNGPRKNFTRIQADGPFPAGMKATADRIRAQGLTPGLWLMPFSGTHDDPWFASRQNLFARRADGTPHDSKWGGTALDMTNPAAQEYLREIIRRIVKEWGYGYLKLDGICSGAAVNHVYVNDSYKDDQMGDAVLHNPKKTHVEAYRDGLRLIRGAAGPDTFLLGCCVQQNMRSYGGAFGLVDAMRIGPDNGPRWNGILRGPIYGARSYHLHGRIWYNDPDPLYVRESLSLAQARAICSWVTLSGQLNAGSEAYTKLAPERLDILRRTMPSHGLLPRPVDLFEENAPRIWLLSDTRTAARRDVIGLFNWDERKAWTVDRALNNIGLSGTAEYLAFDYWSNRLVGPFTGRLNLTVPPASCVILSLKPVAAHPQVISTSRHVTQGIVDVTGEAWDGGAKTLSGVSRVVGGDDYELRVVTKITGGTAKASGVTVSEEDRSAGVTATLQEEDGLVRVHLRSPAGREVKWRVTF